MMKERGLILLLLFLTCAATFPEFLIQTRGVVSVSFPVHNINTGLNYTTIQEAIDANETLDGHTVKVDGGTYSGYLGYPIDIDKSITLIGQGRDATTILGNSTEDAVFVQADNVTIEGFTIKGGATGVRTFRYTSVTNCTINGNGDGISPSIYAGITGSNIIENNIIENNRAGIRTSNNGSIVSHNKISNNTWGIMLVDTGVGLSSGILVFDNTVENSESGFVVLGSVNNIVFHNNLINNTGNLVVDYYANSWDNGFEGNYWSDYTGIDTDLDGIGNTPYAVNNSVDNIDRFPLMGQYQSFNLTMSDQVTTRTEEVAAVSNSLIGSVELAVWLTSGNQYFKPGQYFIVLSNVTGEAGAISFCRLTIPNVILNASDYIVVNSNMSLVSTNKLQVSNATHTYLYFLFVNPTGGLYVTVPESLSIVAFVLLILITSVYALLVNRVKTESHVCSST